MRAVRSVLLNPPRTTLHVYKVYEAMQMEHILHSLRTYYAISVIPACPWILCYIVCVLYVRFILCVNMHVRPQCALVCVWTMRVCLWSVLAVPGSRVRCG